jgi:hypothetical protein
MKHNDELFAVFAWMANIANSVGAYDGLTEWEDWAYALC